MSWRQSWFDWLGLATSVLRPSLVHIIRETPFVSVQRCWNNRWMSSDAKQKFKGLYFPPWKAVHKSHHCDRPLFPIFVTCKYLLSWYSGFDRNGGFLNKRSINPITYLDPEILFKYTLSALRLITYNLYNLYAIASNRKQSTDFAWFWLSNQLTLVEHIQILIMIFSLRVEECRAQWWIPKAKMPTLQKQERRGEERRGEERREGGGHGILELL